MYPIAALYTFKEASVCPTILCLTTVRQTYIVKVVTMWYDLIRVQI